MEKNEIQELIQKTINATFAEKELKDMRNELSSLREENKALTTKLASVEEAEIPSEKVEEITEVVEKALGDKVDSIVGEAISKAVGDLKAELIPEEVKEEVEVIEGDEVEEAKTDRQRIKEALCNKKKLAKSNAFKPMSKQSVAYTSLSDADEEETLEALTEKLKNAKDKKEVEDVKNLLQAFITSTKGKVASKKTAVAEDLEEEVDHDLEELEAYRELGTVDEIEAAVEVIETYAEEIGTLKQLDAEAPVEEKVEEKEEFIDEFSSKRTKLSARKRALMARRAKAAKTSGRIKALKARRQALASKRLRAIKARKAELSAKREAILKARKEAIANKKSEAKKAELSAKRAEVLKKVKERKLANSARVQKIKELKEKRTRLSSLKDKIRENLSTVTSSKDAPGALASALFGRKN